MGSVDQRRSELSPRESMLDGAGIIVGPKVIPCGCRLSPISMRVEHLGDTKTSARAERLTIGVIHYDVTNSQPRRTRCSCAASEHPLYDRRRWHTLPVPRSIITSVCHRKARAPTGRALGIDLNSPALRQYMREATAPARVETRITASASRC